MGSTPSAAAAPPPLSVLRLHFFLGSSTQLALLPQSCGQPSPQDLFKTTIAAVRQRAWEISEGWARHRGFYRPRNTAGGGCHSDIREPR